MVVVVGDEASFFSISLSPLSTVVYEKRSTIHLLYEAARPS